MDEAANQLNDLEHKKGKHKQSEQEEEKIKKSKECISSLWDNFKHSNICITGVPEGEEKEWKVENLFEKITNTNFPNLVKEIHP